MIPRCMTNCCDCIVAEDDFNRADGAMGANWTLLSGTAPTVVSNELDFSAAGFVRHNTAYPGAATESRYASARVKFSAAGTIEVAVGLTDANNYFSAVLYYPASGCATLTACIKSGGVGCACTPAPSVTDCVNVPGLTTGEWVLVEVCLIPNSGSYGYETYDKVIAKVTLPNGKVMSCQTSSEGPAVGSYAGLKSGGVVKFDDFKHGYYRNSPTGQHRTCPNCNTPCLIGSDDFTTDEPCNWTVRSGSKSVSGGVMTITATGTMEFFQFHPGLKTTQIVTVKVKDVASVAKIYIGNGFAKLTITATDHTLELFNNSSALLDDDDSGMDADSTRWLDVTVCYSRGILSATVTRTSVTGLDGISLCADSPLAETTNGYWASLGGDTGAVFDDFVFKKSYDTNAPSDAGCDDCEYCPMTCFGCCDAPQPAGAYVVDLGIGGWTPDTCADCSDVKGEYVVIGSGVCTWAYEVLSTCPKSGICSPPSFLTFAITLSLEQSGSGCRWKVTVRLDNPNVEFGCFQNGLGAIYYSPDLANRNSCNTVPVTLTKDSETIYGTCSGALPTTITLEAA